MWRREAWRASQWFLLAACGLGISGGRDANTLPGRHTWSPRAAGWGKLPPRFTRRGAGSVCALRGGHETGQLDEGGETQAEGVLGKRQREDAVGEGVSNVGTAGDSKQMPKLTLLLQRAAAYSAFLRERLQQSVTCLCFWCVVSLHARILAPTRYAYPNSQRAHSHAAPSFERHVDGERERSSSSVGGRWKRHA